MFSVFVQHDLNDLLSKLNTKIHNWKLWKFTRTWKKPFDPWVHKVMCWAVKSFVVSRSARDNPGGRWAVPRWGCSTVVRMAATPLLKVIGMFRTMLLIMFDLCSCCNMYCVLLLLFFLIVVSFRFLFLFFLLLYCLLLLVLLPPVLRPLYFVFAKQNHSNVCLHCRVAMVPLTTFPRCHLYPFYPLWILIHSKVQSASNLLQNCDMVWAHDSQPEWLTLALLW